MRRYLQHCITPQKEKELLYFASFTFVSNKLNLDLIALPPPLPPPFNVVLVILSHLSCHRKKFSVCCCQRSVLRSEHIRKSNPITSRDRARGFHEVEVPRFQDIRHRKVVRFSALGTGRLYPPGNIPGTHFCYEAESTAGQERRQRSRHSNYARGRALRGEMPRGRNRFLPPPKRPHWLWSQISLLFIGVISWGSSGRDVRLTSHFHLVNKR